MAPAGSDDGVLFEWYRTRIAPPRNDAEVHGYWLFVFGVLVGLLGILLVASTAAQAGTPFSRLAGMALGGLGLIFLLVGPIVRLPLEKRAKMVAYSGAMICILAVVLLVLTFESGPAQRPAVFGSYAIGMAVIAMGAVVMPHLDARRAAATETDDATDSVVADGESERGPAAGDADEELVASDEGAPAGDESGAATSQASFEVYEDKSGKFRWRLRHRNGNILADSGQGYSRKSKAIQGIESVQRNAPAAERTED